MEKERQRIIMCEQWLMHSEVNEKIVVIA